MPGPVPSSPGSLPDQLIGRYALFREIASGGMASVHLGRLIGPVGFSRVVAIKRLHPHLAKDPEFVAMFVEEARLAARVQHPNVVPTLDVVALPEEIFIVMEYVEGESLSKLVRMAAESGQQIPLGVSIAIVLGALHGLHAAHEARDEEGQPMQLVHRDISPQNVLVGIDGLSRVVDFGIAKVAGRGSRTASGVLKGKLAYMAPEQIKLEPIDRRTDVYAIGVVLWEACTGRRLFTAQHDWDIAAQVKAGVTEPPSAHNPEIPAALDRVVLRACAADPEARYQTALEMADALEQAFTPATTRAVGRFVETLAAEPLARRKQLIADAESVKSDVGTLDRVRTDTDTLERNTRVAGAFARPSGPMHSAPAHSAPISVRSLEDSVGTVRTAATWSTGAAPRRLSAPLIGVAGGIGLALLLGTVALVVELASTENDEPAVRAVAPTASSLPAKAAPPPPPAATIERDAIADEIANAPEVEAEVVPDPPATSTRTSRPPAPKPPPVKPTATGTKPKPNCQVVPVYTKDRPEPYFKKVCK